MNTRAQLMAGGENGKSIILGNSTKSLFLERITSDDKFTQMPPEGPRVPPEKIAILKKWIDEGLPWEPGITLGTSSWEPPLKPRVITLPPPTNGRQHPIDRLLDAGLAIQKQPTPPSHFRRRVSSPCFTGYHWTSSFNYRFTGISPRSIRRQTRWINRQTACQ